MIYHQLIFVVVHARVLTEVRRTCHQNGRGRERIDRYVFAVDIHALVMKRFGLELVQPGLDAIHRREKILCGPMRGYDLVVRSVEQTKGQKRVLWIIKEVIELLIQSKGRGKADQML